MCLYALTSSANTPGRLSTPVTELADVLELMRRPGARFRTLQATGRDWQHRSRIDHAYGRGRPIGLAAISLVRTPGEGEPEESENIWRTWVELPDHRREEFAVGNETVSVVFVGSTWWSWSASRGGQTNGGRANSRHGVGPAERLLRPAAVLSSVELDVLGRTEVLSRQAYRVRAVPVTAHDFLLDRSDTGADEHELLVDAERGFLLRAEARLNGEPFRVLEMTDLAVDVDIPAATFMPAAPDGEGFVELPPRTVLLAELPKMPFKVFLPDPAPGKPGHVVLHYADRPRGAPLSATITYLLAEPGRGHGNLWVNESAEQERPSPESAGREVWRQVGDLLVSTDNSMGYLRCKVRLVREGTHIKLESTAMQVHQLVAVARTLVPLPEPAGPESR